MRTKESNAPKQKWQTKLTADATGGSWEHPDCTLINRPPPRGWWMDGWMDDSIRPYDWPVSGTGSPALTREGNMERIQPHQST
jgi:hypothetical protein